MQKIIFGMLLLLNSSPIFSQYRPMLIEGNIWHWYVGAIGERGENYARTVRGDSVVNDITYKKLVELNNKPNTLLFREDTIERKVFIYNDSSEQLAYDFSLVPGDTFYRGGTRSLVQSIIDSIPYSDRRNIYLDSPKVFILSDIDQPWFYVWVEGIGSLCGIFTGSRPCLAFGGIELLCHFDSSGKRNFHYAISKGDSCEAFASIGIERSDNNNSHLSVYPNPASSDINFEWEVNLRSSPYWLKFYSQTGQLVYTKLLTNTEKKWTWHTGQIEPGVLIYTLEDKNEKVLTRGKVIILP